MRHPAPQQDKGVKEMEVEQLLLDASKLDFIGTSEDDMRNYVRHVLDDLVEPGYSAHGALVVAYALLTAYLSGRRYLEAELSDDYSGALDARVEFEREYPAAQKIVRSHYYPAGGEDGEA